MSRGFLIVPVIGLLEPRWEARTITAYSLAVVNAHARSGTAASLRQRRVDLRSALRILAAMLAFIVARLIFVHGDRPATIS